MPFQTVQRLTQSATFMMLGTTSHTVLSMVSTADALISGATTSTGVHIRYPDGYIEFIPNNATATVVGTGSQVFDRSAGIWLVISRRGTGTIQLVLEQAITLIDTLIGQDYCVLGRVLYTKVVDFQNA